MRRSAWLRKGLPFLLFEITNGPHVTPSPSSGGGYPPDWLEDAEWRYRSVGTVRLGGHTRTTPRLDARSVRSVGLLDRVRFAGSAESRARQDFSAAVALALGSTQESRARLDATSGSSVVRHVVACHDGEARVSRGAARSPRNEAALLLLLSAG